MGNREVSGGHWGSRAAPGVWGLQELHLTPSAGRITWVWGTRGNCADSDQPWPWHYSHQVTAAETRDCLDFRLLGARKQTLKHPVCLRDRPASGWGVKGQGSCCQQRSPQWAGPPAALEKNPGHGSAPWPERPPKDEGTLRCPQQWGRAVRPGKCQEETELG